MIIVLASILIAGFAVEYVAATSTVDQQQTAFDLTQFLSMEGGGSEQILAQVVTADLDGLLTEVRFDLREGSGDLIVEIQGVTSGGKPDGSVLTSETMPFGTLPSVLPNAPPFDAHIVFSTPVCFSAGERFAVVLKSTGYHTLLAGPTGNPYAGGDAFFDARPNPPDVWVPLSNGRDLAFQTFVEVCPLNVIPEAPFGTIVVSASMIFALMAFLAIPKLKTKD
jgi:hypothetical protein